MVSPVRSRRFAAAAACIGIPALVALLPLQAAFADTSPSSLVGTTTTAVKSTTSSTTTGLGLSSFTSKTQTASTHNSSTSSGSGCSGNVVCTDGVTFNNTNGPAVCSLYLLGNKLQAPSNGCDNGTTSSRGNIALAVGRTDVNSALVSQSSTDPLIEADTCGIALALDQGSGSTAKVVCGSAPGLGSSSVDLGNIMAVLGPSYAGLSQGGDLSANVCGAAAALGMNDTKTNADVYCETLSSAQNWQATVPATTVSVGNDILSADVQKTFVNATLTPSLSVTVCNVDAKLFNNELPLMPTGKINVDLPSGSGPSVNCTQDANENPIVSNGALNLGVGDTGAGGGAGSGSLSGGGCGGGGGGSSSSGSTTNSCGTTTPPPGYQTVPGPSNGAIANGNLAVVLGQNNANFGPNSGPKGSNDFGGTTNACGASGSGDPSGGGSGVTCQQYSYSKTAVQAVTASKPAAKAPAAAVAAATAPAVQLAKTGFPLLSGVLGLILIAIGGIEMIRRRRQEAAS